ncbi:hypothetical protein L2735_10425 [Shewanella olleyana]|uniref:hypothetical protein n=1 Tax=Shewanella olleyana TaxID=135626 RepID=UPI00200BC705|nr:hypothetical protein [Shewanella olleyana]MCL1067222.1 hypothetical protein [Shewanella olleyana]
MTQKLVIELSEEATEKYLELARQQTSDMVEEDCEPEDVLLKIIIAANNIYGSEALFGDKELGTVSVELISFP